MPADIYTSPPHLGRGGWTWYTASAGWMYHLASEALLGLRLEVNKLWLEPLLPEEWQGCRDPLFQRDLLSYHISARPRTGDRVKRVSVDGLDPGGPFIPLT